MRSARYFVATAGLTYTNNDYDNVAIDEHQLDAEARLPSTTPTARSSCSDATSTRPSTRRADGDYDVDDVRFGRSNSRR